MVRSCKLSEDWGAMGHLYNYIAASDGGSRRQNVRIRLPWHCLISVGCVYIVSGGCYNPIDI